MWLIPGLGERDMFTQPVLTMRIAQLFLLGACCPEPPLHPEAAPGEVWLKSLCPKASWNRERWQLVSKLALGYEALGGLFTSVFLMGIVPAPFSGMMRGPGEARGVNSL